MVGCVLQYKYGNRGFKLTDYNQYCLCKHRLSFASGILTKIFEVDIYMWHALFISLSSFRCTVGIILILNKYVFNITIESKTHKNVSYMYTDKGYQIKNVMVDILLLIIQCQSSWLLFKINIFHPTPTPIKQASYSLFSNK